MIGPRTFLEYQNYRYLKVALAIFLLSLAAYVFDDPPGGRSGSSWTGYGLGTIAAAIADLDPPAEPAAPAGL